MNAADAPQSWPCEVCRRPSVPRVHAGCQERLDDNLAALPGLYRELADVLEPGRRGDGGRSGSKTAPLPVNERVLDLRSRGGVEGVVITWERDARELLGWSPPPFRGNVEQTILGAVAFLRTNLDWFCDSHAAVYEMAQDVRRVRAEAEALITGERPPRRVAVVCPCGGTMKVTLDTPGARCPACTQQYGHTEVLRLPLAERNAA